MRATFVLNAALRGDELMPSMIGAQLAATDRPDDPSGPIEWLSDNGLLNIAERNYSFALDV